MIRRERDTPDPPELRIYSLLERSSANGPGERFTIWLQGCSSSCSGCCNPQMLAHEGGDLVPAWKLASTILETEGIEGVSVSGGEPLLQTDGLFELLSRVREGGLSTLVFTGFTREMIENDPNLSPLMELCDIVVAGPYMEEEHIGQGLLGSLNQEILFLSRRYGPRDIESVPDAEIGILDDGTVVVSGSGVDELGLEESLGRVVKNPLSKR